MAWSWRRTLKSLLQKAESPRAAGIRMARTIDWSSAQPGRDTVLCLDRSQFIKDIQELRRGTGLNWVTLNAVRLKTRQESWVPADDRLQGFFSTWLREERGRALRPVLTEFGSALLEEAKRTMRVDAVVSANIDYWQDETMKLGCTAVGIPFLVLCRENYTIPWTAPWLHDYIARARFRFEGAGIAVFSETTKEACIPAVDDPNDIWVTGAPRYDRWLDMKPSPDSVKTHLSLITFNDPGYMGANVFLEVAEVFDRVARAERREGLVWMVKCKKRGDRDEILERLGTKGDSPLTFEYDVPLFELYPRSRVVVGYNSLALVEAMLTDAPVVIPCWGETRAPQKDLLIDYNDPLVQQVATFAQSPSEFAELLQRAARGEPLKVGTPEQRRAVFAAHLHVPEPGTTASEAVERFVRRYIERSRATRRQAA
jgi:hypothetical protein